MKKYNRSEIMKRAWELVKKADMAISEALIQSWKEAKATIEKVEFNGFAKMLKDGCEGYEDSESNWFSYKEWKKASHHRIYCNDYKGRGVGYIDVLTGEIHTDNNLVEKEIRRFMVSYSF